MPREYQRFPNALKRATWTQEQLTEATRKVKEILYFNFSYIKDLSNQSYIGILENWG